KATDNVFRDWQLRGRELPLNGEPARKPLSQLPAPHAPQLIQPRRIAGTEQLFLHAPRWLRRYPLRVDGSPPPPTVDTVHDAHQLLGRCRLSQCSSSPKSTTEGIAVSRQLAVTTLLLSIGLISSNVLPSSAYICIVKSGPANSEAKTFLKFKFWSFLYGTFRG